MITFWRCTRSPFTNGNPSAISVRAITRFRSSSLRDSSITSQSLRSGPLTQWRLPGRSEAEVREGSGGTGKRLHYDWSDPNHVVLTTSTRTATPIPFRVIRTARRTLTCHRIEGKNLKGKVLGFVLGTIGRKGVCKLGQGARSPDQCGWRDRRIICGLVIAAVSGPPRFGRLLLDAVERIQY